MPFSSVLGSSSVIRPGVCTSSTRPSVPYEGQLIYETDTDLVKSYSGAAWATVGPTASGVVQVKSSTKIDEFTTSSTTFVDLTGLSVSITPSVATNKVLALWHCTVGISSDSTPLFNLVRDSTAISQTTFATNNATGIVRVRDDNDVDNLMGVFLDAPNTTSATTYKIQCRTVAGTTIFINRNSANITYGGTSSITVFEVSP